MTSSAKLQHQADQARAGLSSALGDLRGSVTTTALTSGAMTFAKDGSSAVAKAAVDRAIANPLAAMLISAGIVMLMSSRDKSFGLSSAVDKGNSIVKGTATALGGMGSSLLGAASTALDATRSATGTAVDTTKSLAGQVSATATSAANMATDTLGRATDALVKGQEQGVRRLHDSQQLVTETKTRLEQFATEQLILIAALGVAFGAVLGASLPITEAERSYMGETTKKLAGKGTDVARQLADSVTRTVADSDVSDKVGELAQSVTSTIKDSLKS